MTDLSQMIRWNANFVRGLAQSVLERAKVIRETIVPYTAATPEVVRTASAKKISVKKSTKRPATKKTTVKAATRKSKKTNG